MGSEQSTVATKEIRERPQKQEAPPSSESGRKQSHKDTVLAEPLMISIDEEGPDVSSDSESEEADEESVYSEEEEDEVWNERVQILKDARSLRKIAESFIFPKKGVLVDGAAQARCYFDRASAPTTTSLEEEEEAALIMADVQALKKQAMDHMHPELPVVTREPSAVGRNYFTRFSAPTNELEEQRAKVLADAIALKNLAIDYLHPENSVVVTDTFATGRNYFSRFSAASEEEFMAIERKRVLADANALKKLAEDYLHPEKPVITWDPCVVGRNYFSRPSAEEYENEDDMDERDEILGDMAKLKRLAQDYLQPERPVKVDALAFCRNYFDRPSATRSEDLDETKECAIILAEAHALKKLAVDYLHPEIPVVTTDPYAVGRNYFSRPSAAEYDVEEDAAVRHQILEDMARLKKFAVDYLHPEKPVVTSDPCATGRNFFSRVSGGEYEDDVEERTCIMADAAALKKFAVDYLHPEKSVVTDAFALGRNYFSRFSAAGYYDTLVVSDMDQSLKDANELKKLAMNYLHPEMPVKTTDPMATGRNYFDRPSAVGHVEYIQTQGYPCADLRSEVLSSDIHHYVDHGYNHYHVDNHLHLDHHDQSDHFEMDEDMAYEFPEFRQSLQTIIALKGANAPKEEEEGNLSRSPSSVMLFDEATM